MDATISHPDLARVDTHQTRLDAREPRSICSSIGLKWERAVQLSQTGLVSFDVTSASRLDESQDAELVFVGTLAALNVPDTTLRALLRGLKKPYAYDVERIFFDWRKRRWFLLPGEEDPEGTFFDLLNRLGSRNERDVLLEIRRWLDDAFELAAERVQMFSHEEPRHRRR